MSLVELGWRQFTFFEKHSVRDPQNSKDKFHGLKNLKACCSASGDGFTLFGEPTGAIIKLSNKLKDYYWIAHKRSLSDISLAGLILATVGEDEDGVNSLVKLWQLDRIGKDTPFCLRVIRVCPILGVGRSIRACAVAFHSSQQHIAVGFVDSSLVYCPGNIIKEKHGKWLTIVNGQSNEPDDEVHGTSIAWLPEHDCTVIFSVAVSSIKSYVVKNRVVLKKIIHDAKGCARDCWAFIESRNQLIVGSYEMVHFYDAEQLLALDSNIGTGRFHALGRKNEKIQLLAFDSHVSLLTKQPTIMPSSGDIWTYIVSIYDIEGQCVAFSCALPGVLRMFLLDSSLMVLSDDGTLAALTEKHISAKLDILFKKNLYDMAVGVAKRSPIVSDHLADIYKKYGDYLYRSGDFENAVQQYMETVGFLEPSYVIKKFLDGSRIKELCMYLEVLHSKGEANVQHTKILLNCYIRLAARSKIDDFINRNSACNVEAAVQVLRSANYTDEACRLCSKHEMHDALLSIMIDDCEDHQSALNYITKLDTEQAEVQLEKYGKCLIEKCSDATMDLLTKRACFGQIDVNCLMKLFVDQPDNCIRFIETALKQNVKNEQLRNVLLELRLRRWAKQDKTIENIMSLIIDENSEEALRLCQMFDFAPGIIHIFSKLGRYEELIEYHMRQNNLREIIEICQKRKNRDLWIDAIVFASREENIDSSMIQLLLEKIEEAQCIHPLVVLEILSRSDKVCVAHVRNYIIRWMKEQNAQIKVDEKTISKNESKMVDIEEQIESINYKVQIFQMNKCSACDTSLQLPAVHFLCKHSYHAHCLESYSEKADHCPACTRDRYDEGLVVESAKNFDSRSAYKEFQSKMKESIDCMALISSYIRDGVFNKNAADGEIAENRKDKTYETLDQSSSSNPFEVDDMSNPLSMKKTSLNPFDEDFS